MLQTSSKLIDYLVRGPVKEILQPNLGTRVLARTRTAKCWNAMGQLEPVTQSTMTFQGHTCVDGKPAAGSFITGVEKEAL